MRMRLTPALAGIAAAATLFGLPGSALALDVGGTIVFSQPGVYGRVDVGRYPQPQVIVAQPVLITPSRVTPQPVYLWVPPGHQKNWRKHCARYRACGVPTYFVQDGWYHKHVTAAQPRPRDWRGNDGDQGRRSPPYGHPHGHGMGKAKGHDRD